MKDELLNEIYHLYRKSNGVCTDTRKIEKGNIFFTLKGDKFDGNNYVEQALENGAIACICDDIKWKNKSNCIYVQNSLIALQKIAFLHRKNFTKNVIAITGTNGKTTTKELIVSVLKQKYKVHYTIGNLNNHIGVPLTILQSKLDEDFWVIEMGASKIGDINELCEIALPNFGLITNCGKAHIEGFGNAENIKKTKGELFVFLMKNDGTFIYNYDDFYLKELAANHDKKISYGFSVNADYFFDVEPNKNFATIKFENTKLESKLFGSYNAMNIAASACVGAYFGVHVNEIKNGIEHYLPSNNRSQIINTKSNVIISDCYNANPTSMQNAINELNNNFNSKNKLLILGDMLELGEISYNEHLNIILLLEKLNFNEAILVGDEFMKHKENHRFQFFKNIETLKSHNTLNKIQDKVILLKGSRSIGLDKILSEFY